MAKVKQNDIKHGHIYLVEKDIYIARYADQDNPDHGDRGLRATIIPAGELLEFRYFSPAHFRDIYNQYFPLDDRQLGNLRCVAKIWEKVTWQNNAKLEEILRLELYDKVDIDHSEMYDLKVKRANKIIKHFEDLNIYTRI